MEIQSLEHLSTLDVETVPLDHIALLVAREKYPKIDIPHYLERLDEFARRASLHTTNVQGGRQIIEALNHYFFSEEGFRGNSSDYYNPSNSYLNDVLDHRTGIPITLSIIYIEIGRRLGIPLCGVNFPGHFLVRYQDTHETFLIDPFHGGSISTEEECREKMASLYGDQLPLPINPLRPARKREILIRMLANLKIVYFSKKQFETALTILNKMLLFDPNAADTLKERGMVYYQLECFSSALKDFESYLVHQPRAEDRRVIEECLVELREKVEQIH